MSGVFLSPNKYYCKERLDEEIKNITNVHKENYIKIALSFS